MRAACRELLSLSWPMSVLLALAGCGEESGAPAFGQSPRTAAVRPHVAADGSVLITDVPHVRQKPDFCGEACVAAWLERLGHKADQDFVFDQSGLDPLLARGCYTRELQTAVEAIGFRAGDTWYAIDARRAPQELERHFDALVEDLKRGVPSIVCMHYDDRPNTTEHFRLVLGYDAKTEEVIYHEPAVDDGQYQRMAKSLFLKLWPLKYEAERWTLIRLQLAMGEIVKAEAAETFSSADFAQHVRKLKQRLPEGFHVVLEPPFVVVGDEDAETVKRRAENTVKWAVERLKKDYFAKDPDNIIDIWLFKDKASYERYTKEVFDDEPTTPFGYYSSAHKALIMNISTGGGTLVHEIVHPFMASNFSACPSWFNEGLASLYEQCGDHEGRIWGYTNWRLRGLQEHVKADNVPPFSELCGTTTRQFYNEDRGTNYAQARYLCLYLQEQGLLKDYYHAFVKAADDDPGGYATLQKILGERDMDDFQQRWQGWVLKLRF